MTGTATKIEVAVKKSESGKNLSTKDANDKDKGSSSPRTDNTAIAINNNGTIAIDKHRAGRRERSPIVKERAVRGVVRWFNLSKGYGFIHYDKDADDIFVHHSAIVRLTRQPLVLHDNQQVEFDIVQGIKGLEAACVSGPNGQRVGNIHPFALRSGQPPMRRRRSEEEEDHDDEQVLKKDDDQGGKNEPIKAVSNTDSTGTGEQKKLAKGNNNGKPNKHRRNNNNRGGGGGTHSSLKDSLDTDNKTKEMEASNDQQKSANANADDDVKKAEDGQKQKK